MSSAASKNGEFGSEMNSVWRVSSLSFHILTAPGVFWHSARTAHRHHLHWPRTALLSPAAPGCPHQELSLPTWAPRRAAEQPPAPSSCRRPRPRRAPSAGPAVESGPAAGRGQTPPPDHFPPRPVATALLAELQWGGRTGPRRSPWVAGRRLSPHRCRRALLPHPPRPRQVAGGLRPFPGRPRLLAPAPGRAAGSGNAAPAASNPSTFLHQARYVTDRGGRDNAGAR